MTSNNSSERYDTLYTQSIRPDPLQDVFLYAVKARTRRPGIFMLKHWRDGKQQSIPERCDWEVIVSAD